MVVASTSSITSVVTHHQGFHIRDFSKRWAEPLQGGVGASLLHLSWLTLIATSNRAGVSGFDDPRFSDDFDVDGASAQSDLAGEDAA